MTCLKDFDFSWEEQDEDKEEKEKRHKKSTPPPSEKCPKISTSVAHTVRKVKKKK